MVSVNFEPAAPPAGNGNGARQAAAEGPGPTDDGGDGELAAAPPEESVLA